MSALWISHVTVSDEEAFGRYGQLAGRAIADHGGVFLARGGRHRQLEGTDRPRNIVVRFPTFEDAVACYDSDIYQEALSHANGAAERDLVIVEEI